MQTAASKHCRPARAPLHEGLDLNQGTSAEDVAIVFAGIELFYLLASSTYGCDSQYHQQAEPELCAFAYLSIALLPSGLQSSQKKPHPPQGAGQPRHSVRGFDLGAARSLSAGQVGGKQGRKSSSKVSSREMQQRS